MKTAEFSHKVRVNGNFFNYSAESKAAGGEDGRTSSHSIGTLFANEQSFK